MTRMAARPRLLARCCRLSWDGISSAQILATRAPQGKSADTAARGKRQHGRIGAYAGEAAVQRGRRRRHGRGRRHRPGCRRGACRDGRAGRRQRPHRGDAGRDVRKDPQPGRALRGDRRRRVARGRCRRARGRGCGAMGRRQGGRQQRRDQFPHAAGGAFHREVAGDQRRPIWTASSSCRAPSFRCC